MGAAENIVPQEWFTTGEAAEHMRMTRQALLTAVSRGKIKPDSFGGRGRTKEHRFHRSTLAAFLGRGNTA